MSARTRCDQFLSVRTDPIFGLLASIDLIVGHRIPRTLCSALCLRVVSIRIPPRARLCRVLKTDLKITSPYELQRG